MAERLSAPQRQRFREPMIVFGFQALCFLITGLALYALYTFLYPYLAIQSNRPTIMTMAPVRNLAFDGNLLFQLAERLELLLSGFFTSSSGLLLFYVVLVMGSFLNELSYVQLGLYHRVIDKKRENKAFLKAPTVSVIIPAHNEERTIEATVRSVLESNYPDFEVIVVNDGSTDLTAVVLDHLVSAGRLVLINRAQGGKAVAVNTGVAFSSGEIVVIVDADVAIERDTLSKLMVHFQDPIVTAVSANIKVGNRINLLTKLQALEYVRDLNLRRRAFDILDTIPVIPGATGAFRKSVFNRVGGMDNDTVVEDMDLTLRIGKAAEDERFESHAVSFTEAPENIAAWVRQRRRWYGGTLQALLKHGNYWWKFGPLSLIGFPYLIASMFLLPIVELVTLGLLFVYLYEQLYVGVLLAAVSLIIVELALSSTAIIIDGEDWRLLPYTFLYAFIYRFLVDAIRLLSYVDYLRGKTRWYRTGRYGALLSKIKPL